MALIECTDCEGLFDEREAMWIAPTFKSSEPADIHVLQLDTVASTLPGPMSLAYCPKCYEALRRENGPPRAEFDGNRTT
jgi:hypothetical protein